MDNVDRAIMTLTEDQRRALAEGREPPAMVGYSSWNGGKPRLTELGRAMSERLRQQYPYRPR